jgi:glycosyltransferase involved in cell wall biosynthesis
MILYIGNKLSAHGYTPTTVETLGLQLSESFEITTISDKKNKILRILDVVFTIMRNRKKISNAIIDTYSTSNFYLAFVATGLCRVSDIPYIPILHGGSLPQRLDKSKRLSDFIFNHSFINVAPSGYLKYEFNRRGFQNVVLIPNNIDIANYTFKIRKTISPRLLWVRSFGSLYNPTMALRVLAELKKTHPEAELCMVGQDKDGSMLECQQLADQLGITQSVTFTGKLTKQAWLKLSEQYDIFINTTDVDNTPVSVIEAMALGLPVVSTNVGGIPYLIDNKIDGLLCEKGNFQDMYEKIKELLSNVDFAIEMASNARKKAESFDWVVIKENWCKILNE